MDTATVAWLLVLSYGVTQTCEAFVPSSGSSASRTSSFSNAITQLYVTSSPPPSPADSTAEEEMDENDEPTPLFSLDDISIQDGGSIYQVEESNEDVPPPMSDLPLPGSTSMSSLDIDDTLPVSEFMDEPDEDDLSFYYRDEDDMLTEREDRLYMDENGVRRVVEKCILVGVEDLAAQRKAKKAELYYDPLSTEQEAPCFSLEESMIEMRELIRTAGLSLEGEIIQRQKEVNPKTYIGSGKVEEARKLMEENDCCTIVFDAELSPGQQKSLENIFNRNAFKMTFWWKTKKSRLLIVPHLSWIFLHSMPGLERVSCRSIWHYTNSASPG